VKCEICEKKIKKRAVRIEIPLSLSGLTEVQFSGAGYPVRGKINSPSPVAHVGGCEIRR